MLRRLRTWLEERRRREAAIERALAEFQRTRGTTPMGGHVLRIDAREAIVRVMYMTAHIPPDRAWYAIAGDGSSVRELPFEDVAHLESPWR